MMKHSDTLILGYHRIAEGVQDPFRLCVRPDRFAAHLEEIARTREPAPLDALSVPSRRPRVVVTFDDGYIDNLTTALPIAESKGVPITVFVTSGMLGDQKGFWWDRLAALLRARPRGTSEICFTLAGSIVRIPLGAPGSDADLQTVRRCLLPIPVTEIDRALDAVSEQWSVASTAPSDARSLTHDELLQLAGSDVSTIGAHTVDHVRLRGRPSDEQLSTIATSKRDLEKLLGRRVLHFAYPFGSRDDFDDHSVDSVRSCDFETACTTLPGTANESTDLYHLPRRLVMDWGRVRFRAQLKRWRLWAPA